MGSITDSIIEPQPAPKKVIPNLLRPEQIRENTAELGRIERILNDPAARRQANVADAKNALGSNRRMLDEGTPTPFASADIDRMVKLKAQLEEEMIPDMPTQAEMRKSPPGAPTKHLQFERKHKENINAWKYISQRLDAGKEDPDSANLEKIRPAGGSGEMNMDNAQIPGKKFFLPPADDSVVYVMNPEQAKFLEQEDPGLYAKMATLSNTQRGQVLALVDDLISTEDSADKAAETKTPKSNKKAA